MLAAFKKLHLRKMGPSCEMWVHCVSPCLRAAEMLSKIGKTHLSSSQAWQKHCGPTLHFYEGLTAFVMPERSLNFMIYELYVILVGKEHTWQRA